MKHRFAVIGLGKFGASVAQTLARQGAEVLAIDIKEERIESLRDEVAHAVAMDARDIRALKAQNIEEMDGVVVAIGRDFEAMVLITVQLMDIGAKRIIARAMTKTQRTILEKMGVKEIISPEVEVGISAAQRLLNPGLLNFLALPDDYVIVEIKTPPNIANRTITDIDLRKRYSLNLITIKRHDQKIKNGVEISEPHVIGVPGPETKLLATDTIILLGKTADLKRFVEVNE